MKNKKALLVVISVCCLAIAAYLLMRDTSAVKPDTAASAALEKLNQETAQEPEAPPPEVLHQGTRSGGPSKAK